MRKPPLGPYTDRSPRVNTATSKDARNDLEARLAAALAKAQTRGQIGLHVRKYSSNRGSSGNVRLDSFGRTDLEDLGKNNSAHGNGSRDSILVRNEYLERPEAQTTQETLKWWKEYLNNRPLMRCLDDPDEEPCAGDQLFCKLYDEVLLTLEEMQNKAFWENLRHELRPDEEETFVDWDGDWDWDDLEDEGHGADGLENFMQRSRNRADVGKLRRSLEGHDGRLRYIHKY